jgi:hypothetical protein
MRPLIHKAQALLLLVVGGLAGAVVASAVLQGNGPSAPVMTRAAEFLSPRTSHLPSRIDIAAPGQQPGRGAMTATRETDQAAAAITADDTTGAAADPTPGTTVVPPTVYSYPPDEQRRGTGGGGSGGGSSPGGSGRGGH